MTVAGNDICSKFSLALGEDPDEADRAALGLGTSDAESEGANFYGTAICDCSL